MSDRLLGWFVGIVDGEGCIGFKKNRNAYTPHLTITNTNRKIIERCKHCLSLLSVDPTLNSWQSKPNYKQAYHLSIQHFAGLKSVLQLIQSELVAKQEQARLVLEFIAHREAKWFGHPLTEHERQLVSRVLDLNKRGKYA